MMAHTYISNGWGALPRAMIFCPGQVPLPISPESLISACGAQWPGRTKVYPAKMRITEAAVEVSPMEEYSFVISLYKDGMSLGFDGTPQQNVRLAAWLRSLMPKDAPPG